MNLLKREKRHLAAITIQGLLRRRLAYKKVQKQRILVANYQKQEKESEELEANIDEMHEMFMKDLMVIRTQKVVRQMIAKKHVGKKFDELRELQQKKTKDQIAKMVVIIQALARGFLGRMRTKANLPVLKKAVKARAFCIECVTLLAVKRCRQCKDRFCWECFAKLHRKGYRKEHNYELIREESKNDFNSPGAKGSRYNADSMDEVLVSKKINPKEWQEFYDTTAKAKYWFNTVSGEASWVNPFTQGK